MGIVKKLLSSRAKWLNLLRTNKNLAFVFAGGAVIFLLLAERHLLFLERGVMADRIIVLVLFLLLFALTLFLLFRSGFAPDLYSILYCSLPVAFAFFLRALCMDHVTMDYTSFLSPWVETFRENGGLKALSMSVGDYNVPYLYILALISYSRIPDLYLIKLVSILFDILLALWGMKLTGVLTKGTARPLAAFLLLLLLPTVILNGAYWGQCDSIYGAFAVLSLYLALANRPVSSVAAIAVSFAFKLQAIFLLPVYFIFLYTRRIRPRHILVFPVTYLWVVFPAVLFGKPFWDTISVYIMQTENYSNRLTLNAPSIFSFIRGTVNTELYSHLGILAAFLFVAALYVFLFLRRSRVDNRALFLASLLFSVGIPLLLPHMHERYFFLADVLSLILACMVPRRFFVPVLVVFASYLGYHAYLMSAYLFGLRYGALALLVVVTVLLLDLSSLTRRKREEA